MHKVFIDYNMRNVLAHNVDLFLVEFDISIFKSVKFIICQLNIKFSIPSVLTITFPPRGMG